LKVRYETMLGQSLFVMGSVPELGEWKEYKCAMTWTDDHVWVTQDLIVTSPIFMYKYVLKSSEEELIWETGFNRIADLKILPQSSHRRSNGQTKSVEIFDVWQSFMASF